MAVRIKDMCLLDRPRERLIKYGSNNLSDSELLAILIGSGNNKYSSKDLALIILRKCGGIKNLSKLTYSDLIKISGIKESKACIILATIEIIKRSYQNIKDLNRVKINNSKLVFEYYKDLLKDENQECFYCLYLDNSKKVINDKLLFKSIASANLYIVISASLTLVLSVLSINSIVIVPFLLKSIISAFTEIGLINNNNKIVKYLIFFIIFPPFLMDKYIYLY